MFCRAGKESNLTRIFIWAGTLQCFLLMIQTWEIIEFAGDNEIRAVVRTQKDVTILQADLNREGEEAQK